MKKRIAYFIEFTFDPAGRERVLTNKVNWLVRHGYDVTIVNTDQQGRKPAYALDVVVKQVDLGVNMAEGYNTRGIVKREIAQMLKERKFRRALGAWLAANPVDVFVSMSGPSFDWINKLKDGSQKVAEHHISKSSLDTTTHPLKKLLLRRDRLQRAAARFDRFVVLTHEDAADWCGLSNLCVITNATSFEATGGAALENKRVIAAGRLDIQKRFDRLIEAWVLVHERHPDWRLNIYGKGELKEALERQIAAAGLHEVVVINKPTSEIRERLQESSIYAMSSGFEGLGMVLLEAMSQGVPCVSMACKCGPKDIITDGVDGILVPDGDTAALAEGICRLIENPDLRRSMGAKAVQKVSEKFSEEAVMKQWVELFDEL